MKRPPLSGERVVALFLFGVLAFNPPLLAIFSVDGRVFGLPVLFVYLFLAWALLIAFMALWGSGGGPRPWARPRVPRAPDRSR